MVMSALTPAAVPGATSRANRGGRPRDWNDVRARRLVRLYVFTGLHFKEILEVLSEKCWKPRKDAANKVLNSLLGRDPRWMRPKNRQEQHDRIISCKKSHHAEDRHQKGGPIDDQLRSSDTSTSTSQSAGIGPSTLEGTGLMPSCSPSSGKLDEVQHQIPSSSTRIPPDDNSAGPLKTRITFRLASRQGTTVTNSTDFSIESHRDTFAEVQKKLKDRHTPSDLKEVVRVLTGFTISTRSDTDRDELDDSEEDPVLPSVYLEPIIQHRSQCPITTVPDNPCHCRCDLAVAELDINQVDDFGNTAYHTLAATTGFQDALLELVSLGRTDQQLPLQHRNSGGQTFMHVLHSSWYDPESRLDDLIRLLRTTGFDLCATDVYGRTFFHFLQREVDQDRFNRVAGEFRSSLAQWNRRDAFGFTPIPTVQSNLSLSSTTPPVGEDEEDSIQRGAQRQTQLLRIILHSDVEEPAIEDSKGRNGLHCLAEVILNPDEEVLTRRLSGGPPSTKRRKIDHDNDSYDDGYSLGQRYSLLEGLVLAGVDVNHYNTEGETVLMAFISYIDDDDHDARLANIIQKLIQSGANLEARNRRGETALFMAATLGRKFAVRVLLEEGANVNVRNASGWSILRSIGRLRNSRAVDAKRRAQLEATRCLLARSKYARCSAVRDPTFEQEWGLVNVVTIPS